MPKGDQRSGTRWVMLQTPGLNIATIGVLLMLVVHLGVVAVQYFAGQPTVNSVYYFGGLTWIGISNGAVWQFLTHAWLHGTWFHLTANAFLFYYAAARLSHVLSNRRIFLLFLVTSIGAGLAQVLSQAAFPAVPGAPLDILVGASGGIMGMLLGFFALSPESRMLFLPVSARNLAKGVLISSAFLALVTPSFEIPLMADFGRWLSGLLGSEIFRWGHLAHFVGGLLGWVYIERLFPKLLTRSDLAKMREDRELAEELRRAVVDASKSS